jgi:hypothetical protein
MPAASRHFVCAEAQQGGVARGVRRGLGRGDRGHASSVSALLRVQKGVLAGGPGVENEVPVPKRDGFGGLKRGRNSGQ